MQIGAFQLLVSYIVASLKRILALGRHTHTQTYKWTRQAQRVAQLTYDNTACMSAAVNLRQQNRLHDEK